ncbi:MAG: hypothetical protein AAF743_11700, partial [Planctomycetota bacterium]
MLTVTNRDGNTDIVASYAYTYDPANRVVTATTPQGTWTYGYDPAGQLTSADFDSTDPAVDDVSLIYTYDRAGNRIAVERNDALTAYLADATDAYTEVGGVALTYDADGNLLFDGTNTYGYDALGRLTSVDGPAGLVTYTYNALGQRVGRTDTAGSADLLVDPATGLTLGERGPAGPVRNIFGVGLLASGTTNLSYFGFDGLGSVVTTTDATGALLGTRLYDPFGTPVVDGFASDFGFLGAEGGQQLAAGLVDINGQLLNPELGRSNRPDLVGINGETNRYRRFNNAWSARTVDPAEPTTDGASFAATLLANVSGRLRPDVFTVARGLFDPTPASLGGNLLDGSVAGYLGSFDTPAEALIIVAAEDDGQAQPLAGPALIIPGLGGILRSFTSPLDSNSLSRGRKNFRSDSVPNQFTGTLGAGSGEQSVAIDPNAITGPAGFEAGRFIGLGERHAFRIDFENLPTATAPAQTVTIETFLDPSWDWRTV